jgi:hypothetical protein
MGILTATDDGKVKHIHIAISNRVERKMHRTGFTQHCTALKHLLIAAFYLRCEKARAKL